LILITTSTLRSGHEPSSDIVFLNI